MTKTAMSLQQEIVKGCDLFIARARAAMSEGKLTEVDCGRLVDALLDLRCIAGELIQDRTPARETAA